MRLVKSLIIVVLLAAAVGGLYLYRQPILQRFEHFRGAAVMDLLPPPLRVPGQDTQSVLRQPEIIAWTNHERRVQGLAPLAESQQLNAAAEAKVDDMFARQYFEHISPSGEGPSDLADTAGYRYILVGENLALGHFKDSQAVVTAWMNSPGHRANILQERYQEIGIAVKKGMFQGEVVWLAVQEFGTPLSSCPQPSEELQTNIQHNNQALSTSERALERERARIESMRARGQEPSEAEIDAYNQQVNNHNALVEQTKRLVAEYNQQVNAFNRCVHP